MTTSEQAYELTAFLRASPLLEIKLASDDVEAGVIAGYGAIFGGAPDSYGDIIAPGAFRKSLATHRAGGTLPVMLWSHDQATPIGRWTDLREDGQGLYVRGHLNLQSERGREAHSHIKSKDVGGLSIGYVVPAGGSKFNSDGTRLLTEVELHEISAVAIPANRNARITSVKNLGSQRELEHLLRETGLSRAAAAKLAAGGWGALSEPETKSTTDLGPLIARLDAAMVDLKHLKG